MSVRPRWQPSRRRKRKVRRSSKVSKEWWGEQGVSRSCSSTVVSRICPIDQKKHLSAVSNKHSRIWLGRRRISSTKMGGKDGANHCSIICFPCHLGILLYPPFWGTSSILHIIVFIYPMNLVL
jgi:hypothetical protein